MTDPFSTVRQAHRICAAYYQQILPLINATATEMGTTFLHWNTWSFCRPPQRNKNPFHSWSWDYLPIMDLSFVFSSQREPGTPVISSDFVLDFKLVTDSELSYEQRVQQYGDNEPVATALKTPATEAKSYLAVYLFSPASDDAVYDSPYGMWNSYSGYPKTDSGVHYSNESNIKATGFYLDLHEIADDNGFRVLTDKIKEHLALLRAE